MPASRRTPAPDGPAVSQAAANLFLARPHPDAVARHHVRALVVEDNEESSAALVFLLRAMGYEVRSAADGAEALRVAREFRPTLILSDLNLPNRDGFELALELQTDPELRDVPLVALTGHDDPDVLSRALDVGFTRFLEKPVLPDVLRDTIEGVLRHRGLQPPH